MTKSFDKESFIIVNHNIYSDIFEFLKKIILIYDYNININLLFQATGKMKIILIICKQIYYLNCIICLSVIKKGKILLLKILYE